MIVDLLVTDVDRVSDRLALGSRLGWLVLLLLHHYCHVQDVMGAVDVVLRVPALMRSREAFIHSSACQ